MRTSHRTTEERPSLFPFLSVLVCLIGVLVFLAAAVAPSSIESASSDMELVIEAEGARHDKAAIILDCTAEGARSLEGGLSFKAEAEKKALQSGEFKGTPFTDFLNGVVAGGSKDYVLFVVRPEGLATFRTLRAVIVERNRITREKSVRMAEAPAAMPAALAEAGARYAQGRLYFAGRMDASQREELRALFSERASRQAVEALFEQTQPVPAEVSYGTELLPGAWRLQASRVAESSQDNTGIVSDR